MRWVGLALASGSQHLSPWRAPRTSAGGRLPAQREGILRNHWLASLPCLSANHRKCTFTACVRHFRVSRGSVLSPCVSGECQSLSRSLNFHFLLVHIRQRRAKSVGLPLFCEPRLFRPVRDFALISASCPAVGVCAGPLGSRSMSIARPPTPRWSSTALPTHSCS